MIIITDEILLNVFGKERVPFCRDLLMYSLKALIEKEAYGKDITDITQYDPQRDAQEYVDNWMNSTIAKKEAEEYFKGEDDMNKYETLLKKYGKLCREFESYKEVTEDIADKGTYITNEALEELLETKKKYDTLFKEHKAYCYASEDVAVKLIKTEKKYDELKNERDDLVKEVYYLHEVINEKNNKCKEKMEKIKQRDKQITKLIDEKNALHTLYLETAKERDNFEKRLDHINAMSNLEWEFEVVEETETTRTPYDELVSFCETRHDSCVGCPHNIACDGINHGLRPNGWNEDEIAEYNELMNMKEDK